MDENEKILMKGNEAIACAALRAGCDFYAGYPITPQNELIAYMAKNMPEQGGVFIQAESETAAINMIYGAAAAGARAMTSSSSPGISLKQEGISYAAGAGIPLVIVNVSRGGPGLGSIAPAQSDYFQSTRGGGHGDYRCIVLAPKSAQECADLSCLAFDLAEKWRIPVIILADGLIGQMMEGVVLPPRRQKPNRRADTGWTVGNMKGRPSRHITSLHLNAAELDALTVDRFSRYKQIAGEETRFEIVQSGAGKMDAVIAAYGSAFRSSLGAQNRAEQAGINVSLFRPITLWPFPARQLADFAAGKPVLVVEMSQGQMLEDVKLAFFDAGRSSAASPIHFLGHSGGVIINEEEIFNKLKVIINENGKV